MDIIRTESVERLFRAIMSLKSIEEYYEFFEDACTVKEIQEISQRFDVAAQLWQGKSYSEVNRSTGSSTATICRVKKCLMYGSSGYRTALERIEGHPGEAK